MNFFALQKQARRASRRMVVLFLLAVVAIIVAVDAIVVFFGYGKLPPAQGGGLDYQFLGMISLGLLVLIGLASLQRTLSLRAGGSAVAHSMGATPVNPDTTNPAWRRLRNIIEEVAIASGVPVPDVYVMEHELGINAFAAGYSPADAAICVTQGSLDKLTRDELQGVIAHEFSHILNGDMRLNIRLIGLLFGILAIGIVGRSIMYSGAYSRSRRGGNGAAIIGLALLLVGYIGFFFGRLIQASVARSRESLADASAVQFTRQNAGIAGALKKIAALSESSLLQAQNTDQVAHMLFGEGMAGFAMFATHPPLLQRIKALQPEFDPEELKAIAKAWSEPVPATHADAPQASLAGFAPALAGVQSGAATATPASGSAAAPGTRTRISAEHVTQQVASATPDHFQLAQTLRKRLPQALTSAASDTQMVPWLLLAMAVARTGDARTVQTQLIAQMLNAPAARKVNNFVGQLEKLDLQLRLPLATLAIATVRRLPRSRQEKLMERINTIMHVDGEVSMEEYCLSRMVQVQVLDALKPPAAAKHGHKRLRQCQRETRDLFALVAHYGNDNEDCAQQAFAAACAEAMPDISLAYAVPDDWQQALDNALAQLDRLPPEGKERIVRGLSCAIRFDGQVTVSEGELLRVVCAALHCPLPPFVRIATAQA